jgi:hypothetical protein
MLGRAKQLCWNLLFLLSNASLIVRTLIINIYLRKGINIDVKRIPIKIAKGSKSAV